MLFTRITSNQDKKYNKVTACLFNSHEHAGGSGVGDWSGDTFPYKCFRNIQLMSWSTLKTNDTLKIKSIILPFTSELRKLHIWSNNTC